MIAKTVLASLLLLGCSTRVEPARAPASEEVAPEERAWSPWPVALEKVPIAEVPLRILDPNRVAERPRSLTGDIACEPLSEGRPGQHRCRAQRPLMTVWLERSEEGGEEFEADCGSISPSRSAKPSSLRWEVLSADGDGVKLEVIDGWLDHATCEITQTRTTTIRPAAIVDGLLYAFRTEGRHDTLDLIFPASATFVASQKTHGHARGDSAVARASLPLDWSGLSFIASVNPKPWLDLLHPRAPNTLAADLQRVVIGLEITQSSEEDVAIAIAYVRPPRPESPGSSSRDFVFEE